MIRKAVLPIDDGHCLDLYSAAEDFRGTDIVARYDAASGICALYIKFESIAFRVFGNGTVLVFGVSPAKKQEELLYFLWKSFLHQHVVETI